jgi:hypothetical protein
LDFDYYRGDGVGVGSIGVGDGVALGVPSGVGEGVPLGAGSVGGVPSGDAVAVGDGCGFTSLHAALQAANAVLHAAWFAFSGFLQAWYCVSQSFWHFARSLS